LPMNRPIEKQWFAGWDRPWLGGRYKTHVRGDELLRGLSWALLGWLP
jgi:hypothetical protein